jgi:hypothetical protein
LETSNKPKLSRKRVFFGGVVVLTMGLGFLCYDIYGLVGKSKVFFIYPKGVVYYSVNPIMFWISGIFWVFASSAFIYIGIKGIWSVVNNKIPVDNDG